MPGIKIARGTDPFKKYWWVLLLAFGAVGGWVCLPALDGAGGGAVPAQEGGLKTADQSLDSAENPSGAPGSALDMPGAHKKAAEGGSMASSLYQAPDEVAASTAIVPAGATFADALRDITRASSAKAAVTASAAKGGWGETPQRGFTAPKANFGSMSGFGGGSGSAASASSGGGAAGGSVSGFGGKGPNTGVSFAKGLKDDGSAAVPGAPNVAMRSLENAKIASVNAAGASSNDVARAAGGASFDGGGGGGRIAGGGAAQGASAGLYGKLDAAPANLKQNDPKLNQSKITPVPKPVPIPPQPNMMQQMMMQMIMSIAMAGIMAIL